MAFKVTLKQKQLRAPIIESNIITLKEYRREEFATMPGKRKFDEMSQDLTMVMTGVEQVSEEIADKVMKQLVALQQAITQELEHNKGIMKANISLAIQGHKTDPSKLPVNEVVNSIIDKLHRLNTVNNGAKSEFRASNIEKATKDAIREVVSNKRQRMGG
jgi:hypothetical protein